VPRRINLLCDRALLGAYAESSAVVSRRILDRAAAEVFDRASARADLPGWAWGLAGVALAATVVALVWPARPGPKAMVAAPLAASAVSSSSAASAASAPAAAASSASAVAAPASAVAPQPAASAPPRFDPATDLALLPRDERVLWRELAQAWAVELPPGDPCTGSAALLCFRTAGATLTLLRQLDRPGLLTLVDAPGHAAHVRLVGLDAHAARLAAGEREWTLPLDQLAGLWHGDFASFWRPPAGYTRPLATGAEGPAVQALATALARLRHEPEPAPGALFDAALRDRLAAFQLAQGQRPDGVAGPATFMLLNRALGVAEPRLTDE